MKDRKYTPTPPEVIEAWRAWYQRDVLPDTVEAVEVLIKAKKFGLEPRVK